MCEKVVRRFQMAERVAARAMKPEKLQALMLKLRKGAGTSLKLKELIPIFDHLGGWRIEDTMLLVGENRGYVASPTAEERTYANSHPQNVLTHWDMVKRHEVGKLPNPEQMKVNERVYMDVTPIETGANGLSSFKYKCWQASRGTRVLAPNGKSTTIAESLDKFLDSYPSIMHDFTTRERFSEWLKSTSPFLDQINEKLGTEPVELEKQKRTEKRREELKEIARTKENVGECPVCEGMFRLMPKTREGKDKTMPGMVLHGYNRPGTGTIHNNCEGEFWPPFEISTEGAVHYLGVIRRILGTEAAYLDSLEQGKIDAFYDTSLKLHRKSETDPKEWEKMYASRLQAKRDAVEGLRREIARMEKKIASWTPKTLNLKF